MAYKKLILTAGGCLKKSFVNKVMKNEDKPIEVVIMLNGNFCSIPTKYSEVEKISKMIIDAVKAGMNDPYHYLNYNGFFVFSKHIVGFYFREPVVSYQKKAMDLLEKAVDGTDDADSWKRNNNAD